MNRETSDETDSDSEKENVPPELSPAKKSFPCKKCDKVYSHRTTLARHLKTNCAGGPPAAFPCNSCDKTFNRISSLKRHVKQVHAPKPQKVTTCGKCGKENKTEWHLRRHLATCSKRRCRLCKTVYKEGKRHSCPTQTIRVNSLIGRRKQTTRSLRKPREDLRQLLSKLCQEVETPKGMDDMAFGSVLINCEWGWSYSGDDNIDFTTDNPMDEVGTFPCLSLITLPIFLWPFSDLERSILIPK